MFIILAATVAQGRYYADRLGLHRRHVVTELRQLGGLRPEVALKVGTFGSYGPDVHRVHGYDAPECMRIEQELERTGTLVLQGPLR